MQISLHALMSLLDGFPPSHVRYRMCPIYKCYKYHVFPCVPRIVSWYPPLLKYLKEWRSYTRVIAFICWCSQCDATLLCFLLLWYFEGHARTCTILSFTLIGGNIIHTPCVDNIRFCGTCGLVILWPLLNFRRISFRRTILLEFLFIFAWNLVKMWKF